MKQLKKLERLFIFRQLIGRPLYLMSVFLILMGCVSSDDNNYTSLSKIIGHEQSYLSKDFDDARMISGVISFRHGYYLFSNISETAFLNDKSCMNLTFKDKKVLAHAEKYHSQSIKVKALVLTDDGEYWKTGFCGNYIISIQEIID